MNEKPTGAGKSSYGLIDAEKLFLEIGLKEDTVFLDAACGRGDYSIAASRYIGARGRIYAFDLWKEGIDFLNHEIAVNHIENIYTRVINISRRIPLEDRSVDICLMATVLHDLILDKTDRAVLKEIRRVLKHHGTLAVVEFKKIAGPPGPPVDIRIDVDTVEVHLRPFSFHLVRKADLGPATYLAVFALQGSRSKRQEK